MFVIHDDGEALEVLASCSCPPAIVTDWSMDHGNGADVISVDRAGQAVARRFARARLAS